MLGGETAQGLGCGLNHLGLAVERRCDRQGRAAAVKRSARELAHRAQEDAALRVHLHLPQQLFAAADPPRFLGLEPEAPLIAIQPIADGRQLGKRPIGGAA